MILVTGAAGHLGNVLIRTLINEGESVRALVMSGEDCCSLENLDVERVEGNILHPSSLKSVFEGVDTVYHLAALVSIGHAHEDKLHQVNVEGTRHVIAAARQAGVRRLVYTSSIHALERPPLGTLIDESLPFDVKNPAGPYDRSKAQASLLVQQAACDGLDSVIVCPTGVIGPYDYRRSEMGEMILEWMKRRLGVIIHGFFDFVDVRDIAQGHILAARQGCCGETYLLGGERIRISDMRKMVQQAAGIQSPAVVLPYWLAQFAACFTPLYYRAVHSRPRFTRYSLETLVSNSVVNSDKARRELGYSPRSLHDSIQDTVRWWLQNQELVQSSLRG